MFDWINRMRQPLSLTSKSAAEKSRLRRREFLKLAPMGPIGAFAIPRVQRVALPLASDLTGRALGGLHATLHWRRHLPLPSSRRSNTSR
jgi:hypothetical protein